MGGMRGTISLFTLFLLVAGLASSAVAAQGRPAAPRAGAAQVIFDTDIGDDIDDAYALGFLLRSPEVQVLGVTTAFEDTHSAGAAGDAVSEGGGAR